MDFDIRTYHPSDLSALYRICLLTADSGADARHLYSDPDLPGHLFVAPYAVFEPDLAFVLTADDVPCGYIVGARDTESFCQRCAVEWFPVLRARYPMPPADDGSRQAHAIRVIHAGYPTFPELAVYPAHLHINLLPVAQGVGLGRQMIDTLLARLRTLRVAGVHLGTGKRNERAVSFYSRLGFHVIAENDRSVDFGMMLDS